jgi:hypothetical protein
MISQETLTAVNDGVLTDKQLDEAISHYKQLESLLKPHGKLYHLVWKDVYNTLSNLEGFKSMRKLKGS